MQFVFEKSLIDCLCNLLQLPQFFEKSLGCLSRVALRNTTVPPSIAPAAFCAKFEAIWAAVLGVTADVLKQSAQGAGRESLEAVLGLVGLLVRNDKAVGIAMDRGFTFLVFLGFKI